MENLLVLLQIDFVFQQIENDLEKNLKASAQEINCRVSKR